MEWLVWLALGLFALVCCLVGTKRTGASRVDGWLLPLCFLGGGLGAVYAVNSYDPEVWTSAYVQGILLGIAAGVVPAVSYYALGRILCARPVALGVVFVVTL